MTSQTTWRGPTEESVPATPAPGVVGDIAWILGYFVVAGVVAGLLWWKVIDPPYFVRNSQGAVMDQAQLSRRVQADGWFATIGVVAGLVGGVVLTRWRDRLPLLTVLLGFVASLAGGLLALKLGTTLGHNDVSSLVKAAKPGAHVTDSLRVISKMVLAAWPVGFLVGSVAVLWGTKGRQPHVDGTDPKVDKSTSDDRFGR